MNTLTLPPCPRCGSDLSFERETDGTLVLLCLLGTHRWESKPKELPPVPEEFKGYGNPRPTAGRNKSIKAMWEAGYTSSGLSKLFGLKKDHIKKILHDENVRIG
jgi:hypothetical protein